MASTTKIVGGIEFNATPRPIWDRSLDFIDPAECLVISDDGRDPDDTYAKATLRGIQALGAPVLVKGYVANFQPSLKRAAMANASVLNLNYDFVPRVGFGTNCGRDDALKSYEHDPQYANESDITLGYDLMVRLLEVSRPKSITLILLSALTDACAFIERNVDLVRRTVKEAVVMGGVEPTLGSDEFSPLLDEFGFMIAEKRASNNEFDYPSALTVYRMVQSLEIPLVVLSRHAAGSCKIPKAVYDDLAALGHPEGIRLRDMQRAALLDIWKQLHLPADSPERSFNRLLTVEWFCNFFLGGEGSQLSAADDPWPLVKDLAIYDAVTVLAAFPKLRERLFCPVEVQVGSTVHALIGVSKTQTGIKDPEAVKRLLVEAAYEAMIS
jgi:hypothetical protein